MGTSRTQWVRRAAGVAVGIALGLSAGAGMAAAAPGDPPLTLAHFVAPGKPVFVAPDGQSGATYHSHKAGETVLVQCSIVSSIGGGWFTGGTAETYRAEGIFGRGYVAPSAVQLPPGVNGLPGCGWIR